MHERVIYTGYPLNRENTGNLEMLPKHREFRNFAKIQGIWFSQVVDSFSQVVDS